MTLSKRHSGQCVIGLVTTEDFIRTVEEVTGREWDWFFNLYLRQPKLPRLVSRYLRF